MSIIFCNIGWMERYDGIDGDSIQRGGSYNNDSIGHEVCNFTNANGKVYGYVQSTGRISVEKLGAKKGEEYADGVTVVWTAGPDSGGTAVVGWYKNATVYRELQRISKPSKNHRKNEIEVYRISASAGDVRLLPAYEREFMIPRAVKGGIGQSNVWYADKPESAELVDKVLLLIERDSRPDRLPDVDSEAFGSEGNPRLVSHFRRERNSTIVKKKRAAVLAATGALCCEVCGFDFEKVYGKHGEKFCEVHHLTPLHKSDRNTKTKLSELAVVCSNCHRIIHRMSPMPSISGLKNVIFDN
ncbi:HNH endonuclease [Pseudomonas laurylsulfativorans]|uniref:HNH endonuclease n=1 Tax=Pseudomonas laurylsulfativorans TaxID=1943631 RepID=A0A2S3VTY7_9PSED|nr:HNH endonuclease [Pseudomonas laurylsulfativorans]POF43402.1 HNH endonuclease [Pseudomonas laurylsulfativorans]